LSKKTTSREVAKTAGVSQSLVSLILNNVPDKKIKPETRKLVIETAKSLNYMVNINARSMKNHKAGAIGLLSAWDSGSFVFPPVINGIKDVCDDNDLGLVICTGKKDIYGKEDYVNYYLQNRIDGLIYVSYVGVTFEGVIEGLVSCNIPFVCIIGARDLTGVSCVDVNFIENGYLAASHLVDKGCKNIGFISGNKLNYAEKERFQGSNRAITEGKALLIQKLLQGDISDEQSLLNEMEAFIYNSKVDGLISTSYNCYLALKAAARLGIKVPQELKVISLDNEAFAPYLYPSLTTVDEPLQEIAKRAGNILLDKINGDNSCRKLELSPELTIRDSTVI
jgi:LacI family transcriptional regulator